MNGGGRDAPPSMNGGQFLLQLLQKPPHQPPAQQQREQRPPSQNLSHDPAVAAVGPAIPFSSATLFPPSNGLDRDSCNQRQHQAPVLPPWPHHQSPPLGFAPHVFFPQNPNPSPNLSSLSPPGFNQVQQQLNFIPRSDDKRLGFLGTSPNHPSSARSNDQNLIFGTLHGEDQNLGTSSNGNVEERLAQFGQMEVLLYGKHRDMGLVNTGGANSLETEYRNSMNFNKNIQGNVGDLRGAEQERSGDGVGWSGWGKHGQGGSYKGVVAPPGFTSNSRSGQNKDHDRRRSFEQNVGKGKSNFIQMNCRNISSNDKDGSERRFSESSIKENVDTRNDCRVSEHLDFPGPPTGVSLKSVSASDVEESLILLHAEVVGSEDEVGNDDRKIGKSSNCLQDDLDDLEEQLVCSLGLDDLSNEKKDKANRHGARNKDYRSDKRGKWILGQRVRISKRYIECRSDVDRLNAHFLAIYESLIPAAEEKAKQNQLLTLLEKLVCKEWPDAQFYVYGSCANSFGFSKSDIDICLAIQDMDINKADVLLKLAEILQSDNLRNVQALTRARVPIVKLMDPVTGISCDICINNVLAVVNTKLLRDYAKIDARLRQLAFIVKHWAKSRGVNETYQGTLSSYAYVLMCIHFLQQRKPAILPCLQGMEATYSVTVDDIECAYFDKVDNLYGFGCQNGESIAKLVWAFFNYWAYYHDYTHDVISVRTGHILSKRAKDWTRRIANDRHLICIEDPFETSHDLGRVVDRSTIRVLREEFERAAEIMQYDPDPCSKLFEPYVPS